MTVVRGARVSVRGVVQGVGFRPFIYGLARRLDLTGWVRNTSAGVEIAVDGPPERLETFVQAIRTQAPPLARVDDVHVDPCAPDGFDAFEIQASRPVADAFQPISPDIGLCPDCLREMLDPADRRFRYPFINCTHCGPRFTIIRDIPYDRAQTTMAAFPMCPACRKEYEDPLDRRFHAQPVACPDCGPHIWLEVSGERPAARQAALSEARRRLQSGQILAVKGLGGFHLACNALDAAAVQELRRRKLRVDKPFALMLADLDAVETHCRADEAARQLLQSPGRPVVILPRRPGSTVAQAIAPGQDTLAVMLPYTPLHHLLLEREEGFPEALVMTSGNLSEEPIATDNDEARRRLTSLSDALLMHDRDIHVRCDDSVVRQFEGRVYPIRRSRGYAPFPVRLPWEAPPLLACGAELKNTFCLTRDRYAFLSHHIGDLENYETLRSFEDGIAHLERLFRIRPQAVAYDLHPDYLATRYALARAEREGLDAMGVQHHHAHIAAGMAEHGLPGDEPVIGVAFDGTGYGDDGAVWGGEILLADYVGYRRACHLAYVPLPGGDLAVRQPWRMALTWLRHAGLPWSDGLATLQAVPPAQVRLLGSLLEAAADDPTPSVRLAKTSSVGRLFDAVAALVGLRQEVNYEAQAAMELEALVDPHEVSAYPFDLGREQIDPTPALRAIVADLRAGLPPACIAARFHNGLAAAVNDLCARLRSEGGPAAVVLSGGVWQNMTLLRKTVDLLRASGFRVLVHHQVPANDGGIPLGQAAVAAARLRLNQE
ncbi:MAG: carbamoyltransferase HypF [Chloroflexi bacterium RBG_13_68_17]|nr:MAG: carbamoyltransferase HypF [Chloroflexi bacterium RBG_13_68_17]